MPYRAAIAPELAAMFGIPGNPEPCVDCDLCGNGISVMTRGGYPAQWFVKRRNPPGWRLEYKEEGGIYAKCPVCLREELEGKAGK